MTASWSTLFWPRPTTSKARLAAGASANGICMRIRMLACRGSPFSCRRADASKTVSNGHEVTHAQSIHAAAAETRMAEVLALLVGTLALLGLAIGMVVWHGVV